MIKIYFPPPTADVLLLLYLHFVLISLFQLAKRTGERFPYFRVNDLKNRTLQRYSDYMLALLEATCNLSSTEGSNCIAQNGADDQNLLAPLQES